MPIVITSKRAGFRRAGVPHPAEPTEYPDGHFTSEQIEALKAEPMLVVKETGAGRKDSGDKESGELPQDILEAALAAVREGQVTKDGRPTVEAIEERLGRDVSAEERDRAWEQLQAEEQE